MQIELTLTVKIGAAAGHLTGIHIDDEAVADIMAAVNDCHRELHRMLTDNVDHEIPIRSEGRVARGFQHPRAGEFHFTSRIEDNEPF